MEGFREFIEQYMSFDVVLVVTALIGIYLAAKLVAGALRIAVIVGVLAVVIALVFPDVGLGEHLTNFASNFDFNEMKEQGKSLFDQAKSLQE